MSWKESYNDICSELRIVQIHRMEIERRFDLVKRVVWSGSVPSSGGYCHIPLDKGLEKYDEVVAEYREVEEEVARLLSVKNAMEAEMNKFNGLANVIQSKRMQGMNYYQIADELGYSYHYIRNYMSKRGCKEGAQSTKAS
ncbi:hypothetical protein NST28_29130 [Paenibacillus sp. FSL R10-2791]|uniref:hypothetical protein n=1 Tax=unclassified Paenibacillus TaxID=185978 RepID=UPI0030FCFB54